MMLVNFELHIPENSKAPIILKHTKMDKSMDFGMNWHRNVEILVCASGKGTVEIDNNVYDFYPGDIIVVDSYRLHMVKTEDVMEYYIMIFDPEFCTDNDINIDEITFQSCIRDEKAWNLFTNIAWESKQTDRYHYAGIRSASLALLLYLVRNYSSKNDKQPKKSHDRVVENMRMAVGYIKSHFTEALTIDDICNEVGLSRYHFVREFKKIIGITPVSYINSLRIDKAKRMLQSGNHKISEVQESCGFENASYFTALFKRITGCTPTEFVKTKAETEEV